MPDAEKDKFVDAEKRLKRIKQDCLRWLKGFHNIQRSELFMSRFAEMANSQDHPSKEALFQAAIVNYAKPFTQTETNEGKSSLSIKPIKPDPSFDVSIHEHIMELRKKLIAHDDFTAIEPKYVWISLVDSSDPQGIFIPFQAYLRNSCISYPQDSGDFARMHTHIRAARDGAMRYLDQQVIETRRLMLSHPKEARLIFQEHPDSALDSITGDGMTKEFKIDVSAIENHPVVKVSSPHTFTSFGNYRHTTINVRILFNGPQDVHFAGSSIDITSD